MFIQITDFYLIHYQVVIIVVVLVVVASARILKTAYTSYVEISLMDTLIKIVYSCMHTSIQI